MDPHTRPPSADVIGSDPAPRRRVRRATSVVTGALVLVAGGGAAAWAANQPSPPAAPTPPNGTGAAPATPGHEGPHGDGRRGPGRGFGAGLGVGALHGQLTVRRGGTYVVVLVQSGDVTAVSATSLTVKSADGYTHTYVLDAQTRTDGTLGDASSLKVGDTVGVEAAADGTASRVHERGAGGPGRPGPRPPRGPASSAPATPPGAPAPAPS